MQVFGWAGAGVSDSGGTLPSCSRSRHGTDLPCACVGGTIGSGAGYVLRQRVSFATARAPVTGQPNAVALLGSCRSAAPGLLRVGDDGGDDPDCVAERLELGLVE